MAEIVPKVKDLKATFILMHYDDFCYFRKSSFRTAFGETEQRQIRTASAVNLRALETASLQRGTFSYFQKKSQHQV